MSTAHIRDYQGGRIHLIGIGGSSMSGLAEMLLDKGYHVTGSDRDETYLVHFAREAVTELKMSTVPTWWYFQLRSARIIRKEWNRIASVYRRLSALFCSDS